MSEEVKEVKAKKKSKLPVILVLLLVLGGGGFFMMKKKGGAAPKVVVKAGTVEPIEKEFLINLAGGANIYLRAELALQMRDGYKKEELEEHMPAIRDCINQIFRSKTLQEVGATQTKVLRKEIANAINSILIRHMAEEEKKHQEEFEKAADEPEEKHKGKKKDGESDEEGEHWPCPAGPVLDVYFTAFTTQ